MEGRVELMAARSRRGSEAWGRPAGSTAPTVEVLIPTYQRPAELAVTLSGLAAQDDPPFAVVISDQSEGESPWATPAVASMIRVLEVQGRPVTRLRHRPRRGLAEHRQFLLDQATAEAVLFLDDDVWLEPGSLARMAEALETLQCGFVGSAVQGLSFLADDRPGERTAYAPWTDGVRPERVRRNTEAFARWPLHNAANLAHLAAELDLAPGEWRAYRVAWVGGCVLYRRSALVESGGFTFGLDLEPTHVGEDVAAQWRVMERFGGAGLLPSGAVHLEAPTTVPERTGDIFDLLFDVEVEAQSTPA
jgi:GT2 family glycosyltransferase